VLGTILNDAFKMPKVLLAIIAEGILVLIAAYALVIYSL
jgi:hypothetical protein